jgi:hypothetical protein
LKWKAVLEKTFPLSPLYLQVKDQNGRMVGICPGFLSKEGPFRICNYFSMPYSDYGGPIADSKNQRPVSLLLKSYLREISGENDIAYGKMCLIDPQYTTVFHSPLGCIETAKGVMEIDLKYNNSEFVWTRVFSRRTRKNIRHLERTRFYAYEVTSRTELDLFYSIYCVNLRHIGASPLPFSLVENMWTALYPKNIRVWLMGEALGGLLLLKSSNCSYSYFLGIDREKAPRDSVFQYLIWKEIQKAEEEGLACVSLGSTPSNPTESHHLIKEGFGGIFRRQEVVWFPFDAKGGALLQMRCKTANAWRRIRRFLPKEPRRLIENELRI